jgi:tetratricopeptide (TPR) repeat protein
LDPNEEIYFNNRGNAKKDLKDYEGAIKDYDEAIRLDPKYVNAYNNRGIAKKDLKDYEGAIKDYDEAIRIDPKYMRAYDNRGDAKKDLKDYEGAIKDYLQAIELSSIYKNKWWDVAWCYGELDRSHQAITYYTRYLTKFPNSTSALNNIAVQYEEVSNLEDAFLHSKKAHELDPENEMYERNYRRIKENFKKNG